jgi:hypothetical protein
VVSTSFIHIDLSKTSISRSHPRNDITIYRYNAIHNISIKTMLCDLDVPVFVEAGKAALSCDRYSFYTKKQATGGGVEVG